VLRYEPFSEEVRADPYRYYAELREHAPVYRAEQARAVCVSRHADVLSVLKSAELFSSSAMRTMLLGTRGADPASDPQAMQRAVAIAQTLPFSPAELIGARQLISEDPPRHGALREIVNRGFTPRRVAAWEPRIRQIVEECAAPLRKADGFDLIADLAIPVPVRVISEMLGVEPDRIDDFKRWSDAIVAATTGSGRGDDPFASGFAGALRELSEYVLQAVGRSQQREPGDDLLSTLVAARDGAANLSGVEVVMFVLLLLVAGNETTTNLVGNATHALLGHPEQLRRVLDDRALVPELVEETLRWDAPVQFVFRRANADVEIAGETIRAGEAVAALLGSANRDERQWGPSAARFDVTRRPRGHLAFGFGNHFCLGASLARLEARLILDALLGELPRLARREDRVEYVDSFLVRGPRRLELRRVA
jgi:cytochrome P450